MMKWSKTQIWIATIVLGLLAGLTACNKPATASADEIVVGEFASLTGKEAAFGQSSHEGTLLAIEEINAKGGVLGKKLKHVWGDNATKSGESVTVVKKLLSLDKAVAILGEVASSRSLEGASLCQQAKIPMISPSSTNPKVTEAGDYIFRVCFTDPFQGKLIANFANKTLKAKRVAILTDVGMTYSVGLAEYFRGPYTAGGGQIVAEQKFSSGDKDFKAQLTAIKATNPDGIFAPCYYTEAALITLQARELGLTIPVFGGDGWEAQELIQIGGKAMEGTYYSTHYSSEVQDPMVGEFVNKYKARFNGKIPDAMAALGYDSALVLADAIKRAGSTDGQKLRDALAATKDFVGVTGKTTIDEHRDAKKGAVIITIKDGKFKYVETINP